MNQLIMPPNMTGLTDQEKERIAAVFFQSHGDELKKHIQKTVDQLSNAKDRAGLECLQFLLVKLTMELEGIIARIETVTEFNANDYLRMS